MSNRYEHLIHNYSPVKSKAEGICAVAMQVSLEKITVALASFQSTALKTVLKERRSYGYWSPRRCDVYVAAHPSDSEATLTERLEVTALLWRNNISADMMYEFGSAEHENIVEQCLREGILSVPPAGSSWSTSDTVIAGLSSTLGRGPSVETSRLSK